MGTSSGVSRRSLRDRAGDIAPLAATQCSVVPPTQLPRSHASGLSAGDSSPVNVRPVGFVGATLSGSGPTVIAWVEKGSVAEAVAQLAERFPDHDVFHLAVTTTGAGAA